MLAYVSFRAHVNIAIESYCIARGTAVNVKQRISDVHCHLIAARLGSRNIPESVTFEVSGLEQHTTGPFSHVKFLQD